MTCTHGFIGPCAECDGAGQDPPADDEIERELADVPEGIEEVRAAYYSDLGLPAEDLVGADDFDVEEPEVCGECGAPLEMVGQCTGCLDCYDCCHCL